MNAKRRLAAVPGATVVTMPGEVTYDNAADVHEQLTTAMVPRIATVIVDFTATTFCDTAAIREVVVSHRLADTNGIELRLVVPSSLRRIFTLTGLDPLLPIYPTLSTALNPTPASGCDANR
jgi:anti-sigma B factor antagonist